MKRYALLAIALSAACGLARGQATATPAAVTFTWQVGAALPTAVTVALKPGAGTPAYTTSTPPADQWLICTPGAGTLPASLSVRVNPSTLPPGTYTAAVSVAVTGAPNPVSIPVTLTVVTGPTSATVAPTAIALTSPGATIGTFTVTAGPAPATFTAASGATWLTLSAAAGAVLPSTTQTVTVTANPGGLSPQTAPYATKITVVTDTNGVAKTQTISVNLTVNSQLPTIASVWPSQIPAGSPDTVVTIWGSNYSSGTTVSTSSSATLLKVTLVSNGILLATIPAAMLANAGSLNLVANNPPPGGSSSPFGISVGNAPAIAAIASSASYAQGAISPGEIVTIFGQNLGPTTPVTEVVANGYVQTGTGGVNVTIDGQNAPILFANSTQVTAQVPYNVTLGTQAQGTAKSFTLSYVGGGGAQTTTDIVAAAPGIFTLNASGTGAAIVLNVDPVTQVYSINSATNPAKIGNTIVFFLTGEGDYASSAYSTETGLIVPSTPPNSGTYPQLNPLPTVTIGGTAATTVGYAGPIPTGILGMLQINVVVPTGATTGNAVPLSVAIGSAQTQANITVAISN